jgi:hypothetical protein
MLVALHHFAALNLPAPGIVLYIIKAFPNKCVF